MHQGFYFQSLTINKYRIHMEVYRRLTYLMFRSFDF